MKYVKIETDGTESANFTEDRIGGGLTNWIGNVLKTSYNKLTGYTKIDNRPAAGTSAGSYALQVRGYNRDTSGDFTGVDCEADMYTTGTGGIRGVKGVGKVRAAITATDFSIFGVYGQARVDATGVLAGASQLVGLYGLIEASPAVTATFVCSAWLDSRQANAVTGSHQLLRMTNSGAAQMDEAIFIHGNDKITSLIKLDTCSGMVADTAETGGSSKKIKIDIDGTTYYINAYTG